MEMLAAIMASSAVVMEAFSCSRGWSIDQLEMLQPELQRRNKNTGLGFREEYGWRRLE